MVRYGLMLAAAAGVSAPLIAQSVKPQAPETMTTSPAGPASRPATQPVDPNKVVITVGDEKITAKEFDELLNQLPEQYRQESTKRLVADQLVQMKLMAAEAERRGLDKSEDFQRQLTLMRQQALANALAQDVAKKLGDEAMKEYYEKHKDEFAQVKARHILIRTQGSPVPAEEGKKELSDAEGKAKAEELRKRITGGEDFATVAKAESADKGSGARGGDLGAPFSRNRMVPEFDQVAFSLKEGEISQPVKTIFGYHLIQVQEKKTPTFDEMKKSIEQKIGPEKLDQLMTDLKKKYEPKLDDQFFPPATSPLEGMELPQ